MLGPAPTSLNVHSVVTLHYNALCQDTHLICASFSDKSLNTCYGHLLPPDLPHELLARAAPDMYAMFVDIHNRQ